MMAELFRLHSVRTVLDVTEYAVLIPQDSQRKTTNHLFCLLSGSSSF